MTKKATEITHQKKVDKAVEEMKAKMQKPATKTVKAKTVKAKTPKTKAKKTVTKTVKAKTPDTTKTKKVETTNKKAITEITVRKTLKYLYPKGCNDTITRKSFRQKARNELRKFERDILKLKGEEKKLLQDKYEARKKEILAPNA